VTLYWYLLDWIDNFDAEAVVKTLGALGVFTGYAPESSVLARKIAQEADETTSKC
jgi:hypothetical protein